MGRLHKLAREQRMPVDFLAQAWEIFVDLAVPVHSRVARDAAGRFDALEDGMLNADAFAQVLCKLTSVDEPAHLPEGLLQSAFYSADTNQSDNLDFIEFANWYARHGFSESVLLTQEQREIRKIARKHGLPIVQVEEYKRAFDGFDDDGSGEIEFEEFQNLLNSLIRVPANLQLPMSRVRQFWAETATDGDSIGFEEFLLFYTRYFAATGLAAQRSPLEEFYRAVRPVSVRRA